MAGTLEILDDPSILVEELRWRPETYKTLLGEMRNDPTCQRIVRRKIDGLCRSGEILRAIIPGTRFGEVVFFVEPKNYNIAVLAARRGVEIYYFGMYRDREYVVDIGGYSMMNGHSWERRKGEIALIKGKILRWI